MRMGGWICFKPPNTQTISIAAINTSTLRIPYINRPDLETPFFEAATTLINLTLANLPATALPLQRISREHLRDPHPSVILPTKIAIPVFSWTKSPHNPSSQKSVPQNNSNGRSGIPRALDTPIKPSTPNVFHFPKVTESR